MSEITLTFSAENEDSQQNPNNGGGNMMKITKRLTA
jgi:hypothetical protein